MLRLGKKVIAGKNLQIGTLSDLQGHCEIGDYVRLHSNVHIKSVPGNFVWIFPYVVLTNDPYPPSDSLVGVTVQDFGGDCNNECNFTRCNDCRRLFNWCA